LVYQFHNAAVIVPRLLGEEGVGHHAGYIAVVIALSTHAHSEYRSAPLLFAHESAKYIAKIFTDLA
jgi:hypothetical protein